MLPRRGKYLLNDIKLQGQHFQVPLNNPKDFMSVILEKGEDGDRQRSFQWETFELGKVFWGTEQGCETCYEKGGKREIGRNQGGTLEGPPLSTFVHRKFVGHALPHCCEHEASRDAGESVQGTLVACLVTGEHSRVLGIYWGVGEMLGNLVALMGPSLPLTCHLFLLIFLSSPG